MGGEGGCALTQLQSAAIFSPPLLGQINNQVVPPLQPRDGVPRVVEVEVELASARMRVQPAPVAVPVCLQPLLSGEPCDHSHRLDDSRAAKCKHSLAEGGREGGDAAAGSLAFERVVVHVPPLIRAGRKVVGEGASKRL